MCVSGISFYFHSLSIKENILSPNIFGVKNHVNTIFWNFQIKKNLYQSVTISILGYFSDFLFCKKMQGENANKIHYPYKAIFVLHIFNRILGIPLPGYHGNKNQILMFIKF